MARIRATFLTSFFGALIGTLNLMRTSWAEECLVHVFELILFVWQGVYIEGCVGQLVGSDVDIIVG